MAVRWNNLKGIRRRLDKSQSAMAALLGISTRALQSYEQGWRSVPVQVQKHAALLLFLHWRLSHKRVRPCWETMACSRENRSTCAAWQFGAGDLCWLMSSACSNGKKISSPAAKIACCQACPVTRAWLDA
jgi:DNA-binding XRE family transcriptional regulator